MQIRKTSKGYEVVLEVDAGIITNLHFAAIDSLTRIGFLRLPSLYVWQFHTVYNQPVADTFTWLEPDRMSMRLGLIREELAELEVAVQDRDSLEVADALGDLVYVIYGMAIEMGIDLDKALYEIHRSNLSKLGRDGKPIYAANGKVLKGPDFTPPDLREAIL